MPEFTETQWIVITVICGMVLIAVFGLLIYVGIVEEKRKRLKVDPPEQIKEDSVIEPETKFYQARVISKKVLGYYVGVRMPKQILECTISFLTEEGETLTFTGDSEYFKDISEAQEGTLVTINGKFFYFGEGEEIPESGGVSEENEAETFFEVEEGE